MKIPKKSIEGEIRHLECSQQKYFNIGVLLGTVRRVYSENFNKIPPREPILKYLQIRKR